MHSMNIEDVARLSFSDLEIAYQFYCWYGRIVGFFIGAVPGSHEW